ncbi:hypothetical protein F4859DRAFT_523993 [Xylaria cf. heliscus]|nr:hypothetical protein F4859DRAFT_523993 [Xylaria cf. heliscus]
MEPPRTLLVLSVLGFLLLWGVAWLNGTVDALFLIQATGKFPDGTALRTEYTGNHVLDKNLLPLIAFFGIVTRSEQSEPRWIFFYVSGTIAAANTWVLIESRRRGVRNFFLRHTIIFIFLWNAAGAAGVAPIYFYMISRSNHTSRDPTIPLNEARGFLPVVIANALFPFILVLPPWLGWSAYEHHGYLAAFNLTPLLMIVALVIFSRPGTTLTTFDTPKKADSPHEDKGWVTLAFGATGALAAIMHWTIVGGALFSQLTRVGGMSVTRLIVPSPLKILEASAGSYDALVEGCHLFTQFDVLIVTLSIVVFTQYLLKKASGDKQEDLGQTIRLLLWSVALGPAAAGSFALLTREGYLRQRHVAKEK